MHRGLSLFLVILPFLFSCASKSFQEPHIEDSGSSNVSRNYPSSFGSTWDLVSQMLREKGVSIASARREKGEMITEWMQGASDRLFSGYGDVKIPYRSRVQMNFDIRPSKTGTRVLIRSREQFLSDSITSGSSFTGSLYKWIETASSGKQASAFLEELDQLIKKD